jgi:transposase
LIAQFFPEEWADLEPAEAASRVKVGIETERGPWVQALIAAGYEVFAINPMSVARYRERHSTSGAKSDSGDAHVLAEIVRLDRAHHRPVAGDSELGEAIKLVTRAHQSLVWDRTRHVLRLRGVLREFFPAALEAFADLDAPDTLELLALAPDPDRAARVRSPRSSRCCGGLTAAASRRESHHDPVGVAGAHIATTQPGPSGVRGDRHQPGPAHHRVER